MNNKRKLDLYTDKELDEIYENFSKLKFDFFGTKIALFNNDVISKKYKKTGNGIFCMTNGRERIFNGKKYLRYIIFISFKKFEEMELTRKEKRAIIFHECAHALIREVNNSFRLWSRFNSEILNKEEFYLLNEYYADAISAEVLKDKDVVVRALDKSAVYNLKKTASKKNLSGSDCFTLERSTSRIRNRITVLVIEQYRTKALELIQKSKEKKN